MGYLEEEGTLAFSLRAGRPEPVRKSIGLCRGDIVAQRQRLLLQLLWWAVPGQQALPLALQRQNIYMGDMNAKLQFCLFFHHEVQNA